MDIFHEQIVKIRKTPIKYFEIIGLWLLALIVTVVAFLFLSSFGLLIGFGAFYGAYYLSGKLSIEYEYIVTNSVMDIDRIIAKRSRKRELSFSLESVDSVEKYNPLAKKSGFNKTVFACDADDKNAYAVTITAEGKGRTLLVLSPNDDIKESMKKCMPKFVSNSAFKE